MHCYLASCMYKAQVRLRSQISGKPTLRSLYQCGPAATGLRLMIRKCNVVCLEPAELSTEATEIEGIRTVVKFVP